MLNVHPSLLPRWRGAAPIERAIMAGDEETGVAIMRLTAGLDSGPGVPAWSASRSAPTTLRHALAAARRRSAATLLAARARRAPAVRGAARRRRHLRREDRRRGPHCSTRAGRTPPSSTGSSARSRPHIGARLALPDGSFSASGAPSSPRRRRLTAGHVGQRGGKLLLLRREGSPGATMSSPPAETDARRRLPARPPRLP